MSESEREENVVDQEMKGQESGKGDKFCVGHHKFEAHSIPTGMANLLMIKGQLGFLGCGYFNIDVANKIGEAVALVTGVKSYDDMLKADVFKVSSAGKELGIEEGMKGEEALKIFGAHS
jgi:uncharacterized protein YunC (DUF1805 family)